MPSRLPSSPSRSKQGSFPPAASHRLPRYYEPLGLPPRSARLRLAPYTIGLCPTLAAGSDLPCSAQFFPNVLAPLPREVPTRAPDLSARCAWPSPRHDRLGSSNHLSAENLSRLARRSLSLRPA